MKQNITELYETAQVLNDAETWKRLALALIADKPKPRKRNADSDMPAAWNWLHNLPVPKLPKTDKGKAKIEYIVELADGFTINTVSYLPGEKGKNAAIRFAKARWVNDQYFEHVWHKCLDGVWRKIPNIQGDIPQVAKIEAQVSC